MDLEVQVSSSANIFRIQGTLLNLKPQIFLNYFLEIQSPIVHSHNLHPSRIHHEDHNYTVKFSMLSVAL